MAFIVKTQELNDAATSYGNAATKYENAYKEVIEQMNIVSWDDSAGDEWRTIKDKAELELGKILSNLQNNAKVLQQVSSSAAAVQLKIEQEISKIYQTEGE